MCQPTFTEVLSLIKSMTLSDVKDPKKRRVLNDAVFLFLMQERGRITKDSKWEILEEGDWLYDSHWSQTPVRDYVLNISSIRNHRVEGWCYYQVASFRSTIVFHGVMMHKKLPFVSFLHRDFFVTEELCELACTLKVIEFLRNNKND
jgi:hypothetical protein